MGVNLRNIIVRKEIELEALGGKTLAVDAYNMLYQFLTTIRAPDGNYFTNNNGEVTSHIIGLFSRVTNLLQKGIRLVFVFDGTPPALKNAELARRAEVKEGASVEYAKAEDAGDQAGMRKYAGRMTRLTPDMVDGAKKLLSLLGVPWVQAPSEGEAQCAHLVLKGQAWAVASQDYDSLLYGTPFLVQNLSIAGRHKRIHGVGTVAVRPCVLNLAENLSALGLTQQQLTWLAMLIGTDYNPGGTKGIGPKKALKLVKENHSPDEVFAAAGWINSPSWQDVLKTFVAMPVTDPGTIRFGKPDREGLHRFLVVDNGFSEERIAKSLDSLGAIARDEGQRSLGDF